jgi:hypothetical protein
MRKLGRLVMIGLLLSMLLAGMGFATSGFGPQPLNTTGNEKCRRECCFKISGWCVFTCIVCEDLPVGQ